MKSIEIKELNEREPSAADLPDLTNIEIGNLNTRELRAWAEVAELSDHDLYDTLASLPFDENMINTPGALPALEKFITVLKTAYASREPRVYVRYTTIDVQIFAPDDTVRRRLQCACDYAREKRDG